MANIVFACTCGQKMAIEERFAGRQVKCPACGAKVMAPSAPVSPSPGEAGSASASTTLRPHRAVAVLVLGIVAAAAPCLFVPGIIAWVMGSSDLRQMAAGRMDPSGEILTKSGKICGMIGTIIFIGVTITYALFFLAVYLLPQ